MGAARPPRPRRAERGVDCALRGGGGGGRQTCSFASLAFSTASASSLPPRGWVINRSRRHVGRGREAYRRASRALHELECLELPWLTAHVRDPVMVICSRQFGCLWLMNANRVLCRERCADCCSITFRTTTRHVLAGEERLSVTCDDETKDVHFEILSFSRPRHVLSWLTYPYVLHQQRRFARDASAKMVARALSVA